MDRYFYATITYHSGDKVRLVHKGKHPTKATMALLAPIAACIEVQEPLSPEKQEEYARLAEAQEVWNRRDWHPQMDVPEGEEDGDY